MTPKQYADWLEAHPEEYRKACLEARTDKSAPEVDTTGILLGIKRLLKVLRKEV